MVPAATLCGPRPCVKIQETKGKAECNEKSSIKEVGHTAVFFMMTFVGFTRMASEWRPKVQMCFHRVVGDSEVDRMEGDWSRMEAVPRRR